jgi:all-trans-retinol dehydrogenase (NAD+)
MEPEEVADVVVKQVLGCQGGQIILPIVNKDVAGLRGWPSWAQELIRDGTAKHSFANE